jgi:hypothetical protein
MNGEKTVIGAVAYQHEEGGSKKKDDIFFQKDIRLDLSFLFSGQDGFR